MFSIISRKLVKQVVNKNCNSFGARQIVADSRKLVHDFLYRDDKSTPSYQVSNLDPRLPLTTQGLIISQENDRLYKVSKLENGVTVLSESASSPTRVDLGIFLEVGTRDETNETSGSLLSMKNTYYKTVVNTNETVNYGIIQMSGGDFDMDYDQETTYYKAHCLSHDVVDVFRMMGDCALEPRSVVAANVALNKNEGTHKLEDQIKTGEAFNEQIFKTAFGNSGLGMPLRGFRHNIGNLSAYTLQKFQSSSINPNKIIVCAAGVENHQEFHDLANETLSFIKPYTGSSERQPTEYRGGEVRNLTDDNDVTIALLFPTSDWKSQDLAVYQILHVLLGGRGYNSQSKLQKNLVDKHSYIDSAEAINFNFSDTGLFGVKVRGAADQGNELLNDVFTELKQLTSKLSKDDLIRCKAILKTNVYLALERQADRLEEAARNVRIYDSVKFDQYISVIDAVTSEQIGKAVAGILTSNPTFVAHGGLANRLRSFDQIQNQLRL